MKKVVQRCCIGCNIKKEKNDLIRIVKNKEGIILVDKTGKLQGRGAYICGDSSCLEKVIKSKKLEKVFEQKVSDRIYEELRGVAFESKE